ncbi:MAG: T9SS type A sorting domain-containing protein [Ignavibacteriales bacterium]|nr:T9SS type A sorting domain-containing protein [Ignavibacteriales bacterium]
MQFKCIFITMFLVSSLFAQNTLYVSSGGSNTPPYSTWATAATTIQPAIIAAATGDIILVDDGTFTLTANISITKGVTLRSRNGYLNTTISGNNVTRCLYIDHASAVVEGFTIANGYNPSALNGGFGGGANIVSGGTIRNCLIRNNQARDGGGVAIQNNGLVENCVIRNNRADNNNGGGFGGGVRMYSGGITRGCLVYDNVSVDLGGGINIWNAGTIQNCTVVFNTAPNGGGVRCRNASVMENSIVYYNAGSNWQVSGSGQIFRTNLTVPGTPSGSTVVAAPQFFDADADNFRILQTSPAVDLGENSIVTPGATDLDGNNRIFNTTVDLGAYEFTTTVPTQVSPLNAATDVSIDVTLSWQSVMLASSYNLQVSTSATFTVGNTITENVLTASYTFRALNNTKYYWRVQSVYSGGATSAYSAAQNFTTAREYVTVPGWPIGGATVFTRTPVLTWYHNTAIPALLYDVYYSPNANLSGGTWINNLTAKTVTLPALQEGATYYWFIRTKLASGAVTSYSATANFVVVNTTLQPLIPQLSYPFGGETIYTPNVNLNWWVNGASTGFTYDVEIHQTNSFSGTPTYTGITGQSYSITLSPGTTYYWKVRSRLGSHTSGWSALGTFVTLPVSAPLKPVASWPSGGNTVYTVNPTFYWYVNGVSTGLQFEGEVSTSSNMQNPQTFTSNGLFHTGLTLQSSTLYYWRIRSVSGTTLSAWSDVASFRTYGAPANFVLVPVASWPIGGATVYSPTQTLYWYLNAMPANGTLFDVEFRNGALTGNPTDENINARFLVKNLEPGKTYNWQVRSKSGAMLSGWSNQGSFTTISGASNVAAPVAGWPIGNPIVYSTTQKLSWYMNGPSTGLTYQLIHANNPGFNNATTINNLATASYTFNNLSYGSTIYWKVRSTDGVTLSAPSSPVGSFTVYNPANLYSPLVGGPSGGVAVSPLNTSISWAVPSSVGSNTYELSYSENQNFSNPQVIGGLTSNSVVIPELSAGKTYYWRVRSTDGTGNYSDFSGVGDFVTDGITGVELENSLPTEFSLGQNFPNPFNPSTKINFALPADLNVKLSVYNTLGEKVAEIINGPMNAGNYSIEFNASTFPSGIYFYRIEAGVNIAVRKMILLK